MSSKLCDGFERSSDVLEVAVLQLSDDPPQFFGQVWVLFDQEQVDQAFVEGGDSRRISGLAGEQDLLDGQALDAPEEFDACHTRHSEVDHDHGNACKAGGISGYGGDPRRRQANDRIGGLPFLKRRTITVFDRQADTIRILQKALDRLLRPLFGCA